MRVFCCAVMKCLTVSAGLCVCVTVDVPVVRETRVHVAVQAGCAASELVHYLPYGHLFTGLLQSSLPDETSATLSMRRGAWHTLPFVRKCVADKSAAQIR